MPDRVTRRLALLSFGLLSVSSVGCGRAHYEPLDAGPSIDAPVDANLDAPSYDTATDAPRNPLGCPTGALVCDSFDEPQDAGWRASGGVVEMRDSVERYSAPSSLHIMSGSPPNSGRRFIRDLPPSAFEGGLWVRFAVRFVSLPAAGYAVLFDLGSGARLFKVSVDLRPTGAEVFVPAPSPPLHLELQTGAWNCVELFIRNAPRPGMDVVRAFANATTSETTPTYEFEQNPVDAGVPMLNSVYIGPTVDVTPTEVWLDDVYVGPARGRCP